MATWSIAGRRRLVDLHGAWPIDWQRRYVPFDMVVELANATLEDLRLALRTNTELKNSMHVVQAVGSQANTHVACGLDTDLNKPPRPRRDQLNSLGDARYWPEQQKSSH